MTQPIVKTSLHPRNLHRSRYSFPELTEACPELKKHVFVNAYKDESIDFSDPEAVKLLNKAILKHFYGVSDWEIPEGHLCPPIPGRADYIHYLADLLGHQNSEQVRVLDIGVGANGVYPLIGWAEYKWDFVATDVSEEALSSVQNILEHNGSFKSHVELRHQKNPNHLFEGIIQENDFFDLTMCNPPFHSSEAEAEAGSQRKWVNLSKETGKQKPKLNFGGKNQELIFPGGEVAFIKIMIEESQKFHSQCIWFTSLVSKKESLFELYQTLRKTKAINVKTIEMSQGQKTSRILAWTYLPESEPKKRKPQ